MIESKGFHKHGNLSVNTLYLSRHANNDLQVRMPLLNGHKAICLNSEH